MNISSLTANRIQIEASAKKSPPKKEDEILPEPVKDIRELLVNSLKDGDDKSPSLSLDERYKRFLKENGIEDAEESELDNIKIYGTVTLSDFFRQRRTSLNEEQAAAFSGIENIREWIDASSCNCESKKAKLEEYYKDFVVGNAQNNLFSEMKKNTTISKIIFFYENKQILEV